MKSHRITFLIAVVCLTIGMTPVLRAGVAPQERTSQWDTIRSSGANVLWEEPRDIEQRDLFYGPGGKQGAPDPAGKFTFIRRSTSGTQKKIIVKDDRGREWTVKFGPEARPETASSRIVWAAGYQVDHNYFVEQASIQGYETPVVRNVRFELNDDNFKEVGNWSWESNPFVGTRELDGLKVLVAILKNWDLKTSNNKIALRTTRDGGSAGRVYYISDLGATLGATGSFLNGIPLLSDLPPDRPFVLGSKKGKGHPEAFSKEAFIKEVRDGEVVFNHERKRGKRVLKGITVENARWIGGLLARLSDQQLADAFRAGGFDESETAVYVRTIRERIRELQQLNE
jgi:hypothetical protein